MKMRKSIAVVAMTGMMLVGGAAQAQDKHDFSGLILTNKQGELCTMCEADMTCTTAEGANIDYHFQKRDFWGQMSTVLDYFPFTRAYGLRHTRPVTVKVAGRSESEAKATFDLNTKRIVVPGIDGTDTWVDRVNGAWHGADDSVIGQCVAQKI